MSNVKLPGAPARILIVDDDERLCRMLSAFLIREGYKVGSVGSAAALRQRIQSFHPDLVLLDLMLPDADGLGLARELSDNAKVRIIILSAKDETIDKVVGLEMGADDYITKPFEQRELLARIHSVLRRSNNDGTADNDAAGTRSAATFAGWQMDMHRYELHSPSGQNVKLTTHEFRLLAVLVMHSRRVLTREQILQELTGREWEPDTRSIDVLIGKLRKKLADDTASPELIKTIRGVGYKFIADVQFA